jgi:hypothetical protein
MKSPFTPCHVLSLNSPKQVSSQNALHLRCLNRTKVHRLCQFSGQWHKCAPHVCNGVKLDHVTELVFRPGADDSQSVVDDRY